MGKTAIVSVRILGDAAGAKRATKETESALGKLEGKLKGITAPAALAGGAVAAMATQAGRAASNLQQSTGAVATVFKDQAKQVENFAASAATTMGLSANQYQEMASVMGSQLKNLGVNHDQLVGKTSDLIRLGSDLAATYGGETSEAVQALSALMRGEADPIERYGVSIKKNDINARMAKEGLTGLTGAALKQAETQTMLKMLYEQTSDAQGQFKRETDSEAGSRQILNAQYENTKAKLGETLLPIMTKANEVLLSAVSFAGRHTTAVGILAGAIGTAAAVVIGLNAALKIHTAVSNAAKLATMGVAAASKIWAGAQWLLNVALNANPVGLLVAGIGLLIGAFVLAYNKSETFRNAVHWLGEKIKSVWENYIKPFWDKISGAWSAVSNWYSTGHAGAHFSANGPTWELVSTHAAYFSTQQRPQSEGKNINITVNGALDPVGVANQIKGILDSQSLRLAGGRTW